MSLGQHKDAGNGEIHQISNASYTDYATKVATTFVGGDVGKVVRLADDESISRIIATSSPKTKRIYECYEARVQTTNATETTVFTFATSSLNDYTFLVEARVQGAVNNGGNTGGYVRIAQFKNIAGTLSIVGATATTFTAEDDSNWDCQIEGSGQDILVRVTGVAATTINWFALTTVTIMKDN